MANSSSQSIQEAVASLKEPVEEGKPGKLNSKEALDFGQYLSQHELKNDDKYEEHTKLADKHFQKSPEAEIEDKD